MNATICITDSTFRSWGLGLLINGRFHTFEISERDYNDLQKEGVPYQDFEF